MSSCQSRGSAPTTVAPPAAYRLPWPATDREGGASVRVVVLPSYAAPLTRAVVSTAGTLGAERHSTHDPTGSCAVQSPGADALAPSAATAHVVTADSSGRPRVTDTLAVTAGVSQEVTASGAPRPPASGANVRCQARSPACRAAAGTLSTTMPARPGRAPSAAVRAAASTLAGRWSVVAPPHCTVNEPPDAAASVRRCTSERGAPACQPTAYAVTASPLVPADVDPRHDSASDEMASATRTASDAGMAASDTAAGGSCAGLSAGVTATTADAALEPAAFTAVTRRYTGTPGARPYVTVVKYGASPRAAVHMVGGLQVATAAGVVPAASVDHSTS